MSSDRLAKSVSRVVRGVLRLSDEIDYKALYGATVLFSDGSLATVQPDDPRLGASLSDCRVRRPDGYAATPAPNTACLLGWEGGNPSLRYILLGALGGEVTSIKLGGDAAVSPVVLQPIVPALVTVFTAVGAFATAVGVAVPPLAGAAVTLNTAIAAFSTSMSSYLSTKVTAL